MYKILLRIAAVIMLLHNVGHTIGATGWKKETAEVNRRAIDAMISNEFEFMGQTTTYARFYEGLWLRGNHFPAGLYRGALDTLRKSVGACEARSVL